MAPPARDWNAYYDIVDGRDPRPLLQRAAAMIDLPGNAVDLGCGDGVDSRFLARRGWTVFAVDATSGTAERVLNGLEPDVAARITARDSTFAELDVLPPSDLVHAGYALPFGSAADLSHVWSLVRAALQPGGLFVGQLFGDRDTWASDPDVLTHTRAEAERAVAGLELVVFEETERDQHAESGSKHWHIFDIVARQPRHH